MTTQNGAGTSHSAINWQSFSVPAGSVTRFVQPNADSTSINRVLGGNPSAIFGTLSSNGKLVLVNPAGLTVGAGAVVDAAAFTASTLRMSDADAVSGRMVFGGGGTSSASLQADGQIVARSGDVVLISSNVQVGADALVKAPGGATILAAGQKVAMTGRGLEGIHLELQAPSDQAINLGTLKGNAVGVFAGQLRHSGLIQASAVTIASGPDATAIELQGAGINQQAGSTISTPRGLKLISSGPVNLSEPANSVGALKGSRTGPFTFNNSAPLTVGYSGAGVIASGAVDIQSASTHTVASMVQGTGVKLAAGAGTDLVINSVVDPAGGAGTLNAGRDVVLQTATLMGGGTTTITAGNAITVAPGVTNLNTNIASTTPVDVKGTLSVNSAVTVSLLTLAGSGDITGPSDLTVGSSMTWTGGTMSGAGRTIVDPGATVAVTGVGSLSRPIVNNGSIILSATGQVVSSAATSLDNTTTGIVEIRNDGGFSGSPLAFTNSGLLKKSGGTSISDIAASSFINNSTGTIEVGSGTLRIGGNAFGSNSGTIMLGSSATLDTANNTLTNTAGGVVWGSDTLNVGTANFNNDGVLKPGGAGAIGTLSIVAANVTHGATAQLKIELTSAAVHDVIAGTGNVVFSPGSSVLTTDLVPTYVPGDGFNVVTSSGGTVSGTLPAVAGFTTAATAPPLAALRIAAPPSPVPTPSPTAAPTPPAGPAPAATPAPTPASAPTSPTAPMPAPTSAPAPPLPSAPAPTPATAHASVPTSAPAPAPAQASIPGDTEVLGAALDARRRDAIGEIDSTIVIFVAFPSGGSDKDRVARKNATIGIVINENACKPS